MKKVSCKVGGRKRVSLATIILLLGCMMIVGVPVFAAAGADYPSKPILFYALSSPGSGFAHHNSGCCQHAYEGETS